MELLIAACISLGAEIVKKIARKYGQEVATIVIYGSLFFTSLVYAYLMQFAHTSEFITASLQVFSSAVGVYEIVIKRVGRHIESLLS